MKQNTIPMGSVSDDPLELKVLCRISHSMPPKLNATPPVFFHVMGSFRKIAATNMVNMGVVVLITDRSTGVVWAMA